jgi:PIN domain nuclease of toxin-antitoxin system
VLLDTCVLVYIAQNRKISHQADEAIESARFQNQLLVSAVTAWEIGWLTYARGRLKDVFLPSPEIWFHNFTSLPGIKTIGLEADAAVSSTNLPGQFHGDPADRFLVATSRSLGVPLVTSDQRILEYAAQGHVKAIAC